MHIDATVEIGKWNGQNWMGCRKNKEKSTLTPKHLPLHNQSLDSVSLLTVPAPGANANSVWFVRAPNELNRRAWREQLTPRSAINPCCTVLLAICCFRPCACTSLSEKYTIFESDGMTRKKTTEEEMEVKFLDGRCRSQQATGSSSSATPNWNWKYLLSKDTAGVYTSGQRCIKFKWYLCTAVVAMLLENGEKIEKWYWKAPVVVVRPFPSGTNDNANVNSRRPFWNFSALARHRTQPHAALSRYAKNFQLIVIEMLNCRNRRRCRCDSALANGYRKMPCTAQLATQSMWRHDQ